MPKSGEVYDSQPKDDLDIAYTVGTPPQRPTLEEIGERVTAYYDRDPSELPPADPDEMKIVIRDIIRQKKP